MFPLDCGADDGLGGFWLVLEPQETGWEEMARLSSLVSRIRFRIWERRAWQLRPNRDHLNQIARLGAAPDYGRIQVH